MDLFNNLNWRLTKLLLCSFGGWPFQSRTNKIIFGALGFFMLDSIFIPEIIKLIIDYNKLNLVVEYVPLIILHIMVQIKIISCHQSTKRIKKLLLHVKCDWESNLSESEIKILQNNGASLKILMDTYAICLYSVASVYMSVPFIPKILDRIAPLNESRPDLPYYNTDYFVGSNKYSTAIYIFSCLVTPIMPAVFIGFDSMYAGLINHACSLFLIIGQRIKNLTCNITIKSDNDSTQDNNYKSLVDLIKMHKQLLEFTYLVESNYSSVLFLLMGVIVVGISFTGFQAVDINNKLEDKIRIGWFGMSQIAHLFVLSYFGQRLIDHSEYIHEATAAGEWYTFSKVTKPLIVLIMLRCKVTSRITAGKFYIMSSENFTSVMKTSMSYFTVLTSAQ